MRKLSKELQEAIRELFSSGSGEKLKKTIKKLKDEGMLDKDLDVALYALLREDNMVILRQRLKSDAERYIEALNEVLEIASRTGVMQNDVRELATWREILSIARSCGASA